jgi:alpha-amylase
MPSVCLYFQVHQPMRFRHYTFFDIDHVHDYADSEQNRQILDKVAAKSYLPANEIILKLIKKFKGDFRVAFSISGILLEQFEKYSIPVLDGFKRLSDTGCVEFLNETYYHSLAFLFSEKEFRDQVREHREKIRLLFGQTPKTFRNTELIYRNELGRLVEKMGCHVILAEGADKILGWRSPNYVYRSAGCTKLNLLLRNYRLSDDIAFRFSNRDWKDWPLTAGKFAHWIHAGHSDGDVVNLFMDYETFGEHQWEETGIFEFLRKLPREILKHRDFHFQTPAEACKTYESAAELDVPYDVSWADAERDLTAWLGNHMQRDAVRTLYDLEGKVRQRRREDILKTWRQLQTSDHFYYMCTKWFSDGDVHRYFNPYSTPYDAYINYMNILSDFSHVLSGGGRPHKPPEGVKKAQEKNAW